MTSHTENLQDAFAVQIVKVCEVESVCFLRDDRGFTGDDDKHPKQPGGWPAAHPPDLSTVVFLCYVLCHDPTLRHHRLPNVTATINLLTRQAMYACILETGRGFFEGVRPPGSAIAHLRDPPPPLLDSRIDSVRHALVAPTGRVCAGSSAHTPEQIAASTN
jgi:hypothetical protein